MTHNLKTKTANAAIAALAVGIGSMAFVSSASAIQCKGRYQVVSGNMLSTPFCEDNYLARIARSYGVRVSNRQIRFNPNKKEEVCRLVRHDNRVSGICNDYSRGRRQWNN